MIRIPVDRDNIRTLTEDTVVNTPAGPITVPKGWDVEVIPGRVPGEEEIVMGAFQPCHGGCGRMMGESFRATRMDGTPKPASLGPRRCVACGPFPRA